MFWRGELLLLRAWRSGNPRRKNLGGGGEGGAPEEVSNERAQSLSKNARRDEALKPQERK